MVVDDSESLAALAQAAAAESGRQHWPGLLAVARRIRISYPLAEVAYHYEGEALAASGEQGAADTILEAGVRLFPDNPAILHQYAALADRMGDKVSAIRRWEAIRTRCPNSLEASRGLASAYRVAGRMHDADRALSEATEWFPAEPAIFIDRATIALQLSDWSEALRQLQVVRERFPDQPAGYTAAGHALRHLRRCDEADAITEAGLARFPGDHDLLGSHGWTAMVREDLPDAERRWRVLLAKHPSSALGFLGLAEALSKQQRASEAEAVLCEGMALQPGNAVLAEAFAMQATRRADWPVAVQRWRDARARFSHSGICHHQLGIALKQIGETDTAENVLEEGSRLLPDYLPMAIELAWCANARTDWPKALRLWQSLVERFLADIAVQEGLISARLGAAEEGIQPMPMEAVNVGCGAINPDSPQELLMSFESLGENCEFGLTQRYFGLEPISLFRWVAIGMTSLADALENGLAGVGSPEQTIITITEGHEYYVSDRRYRFGMHSFVQQESMEQDRFFGQQCRRLRYLAGKLLEALAAGEKIFVFFQDGAVNEADLLRLHAAMRRHGDVTLLQVRRHDAAHPAGTVKVVGPGLLIGYIDRFGKRPPSSWDILYDGWVAICRAAYRLRAERSTVVR
jgi:tetratricopeptide (TPR) repeat protein